MLVYSDLDIINFINKAILNLANNGYLINKKLNNGFNIKNKSNQAWKLYLSLFSLQRWQYNKTNGYIQVITEEDLSYIIKMLLCNCCCEDIIITNTISNKYWKDGYTTIDTNEDSYVSEVN